jgi:hypothetical protein
MIESIHADLLLFAPPDLLECHRQNLMIAHKFIKIEASAKILADLLLKKSVILTLHEATIEGRLEYAAEFRGILMIRLKANMAKGTGTRSYLNALRSDGWTINEKTASQYMWR